MESLYKVSKQNSIGRSNSWYLFLTNRRMLSPVTPLNLKRLVFGNPERQGFDGWPFSPSARPRAVWEYLSQKFSFQGSLYLLIRILTGTGLQFRVETLLLPQPIFPNVPSWDVIMEERNQSSRWTPSDALGGLGLVVLDPGWASESNPATCVHALATTHGHLDWPKEKQTKSTRHLWRGWQPRSRQTLKNRCAAANHEPGLPLLPDTPLILPARPPTTWDQTTVSKVLNAVIQNAKGTNIPETLPCGMESNTERNWGSV